MVNDEAGAVVDCSQIGFGGVWSTMLMASTTTFEFRPGVSHSRWTSRRTYK